MNKEPRRANELALTLSKKISNGNLSGVSAYAPKLARGDVITRDGEVLGSWRVVEYDYEDEYSSGWFEFVLDGDDVVRFAEDFAMFDVRTSRGFALSNLTRTVKEWYENQPF